MISGHGNGSLFVRLFVRWVLKGCYKDAFLRFLRTISEDGESDKETRRRDRYRQKETAANNIPTPKDFFSSWPDKHLKPYQQHSFRLLALW